MAARDLGPSVCRRGTSARLASSSRRRFGSRDREAWFRGQSSAGAVGARLAEGGRLSLIHPKDDGHNLAFGLAFLQSVRHLRIGPRFLYYLPQRFFSHRDTLLGVHILRFAVDLVRYLKRTFFSRLLRCALAARVVFKGDVAEGPNRFRK